MLEVKREEPRASAPTPKHDVRIVSEAGGDRPPRRYFTRFLRALAIVMSTLAVVVEWTTTGTAQVLEGALYPPLPTAWHALLAALSPVALAGAGLSVSRGRLTPAAIANGFALGISGAWFIAFLPVTPLFLLGTMLMGLGLLGFAPAISVLASLLTWLQVRGEARRRLLRVRHIRSTALGLVLALGPLAVLTGPGLLTRTVAASTSPQETSPWAMQWLRVAGHEPTLLKMCYERSTSFPGVDREWARTLYFRVTGRSYNEVPPPQLARRPLWDLRLGMRGWDPVLDGEVGGAAVASSVPGLSLGHSALDVSVSSDGRFAYTEWTMVFLNENDGPREARAVLSLPPGAVASRLTLWIDGQEQEAAFGTTSSVRQAYQEIAVVQRRDPALLTWISPGRLLLQCFPVPAEGQMRVKVGVSAEGIVRGAEIRHALPALEEQNFGLGGEQRLWVEAHHPLAPEARLEVEASTNQTHLLRGNIPHGRAAFSVLAGASDRLPPFVPLADGGLVYAPPTPRPLNPSVVLVVDMSQAMNAVSIDWSTALAALKPHQRVTAIAAYDRPVLWSERLRNADPGTAPNLAGWLGGLTRIGGQDPLPALELALNEFPGARVLWVHGPYPALVSSPGGLEQIGRRRGRVIDEFPVLPGANRLLDSDHGLARIFRRVPRLDDATVDLVHYLRSEEAVSAVRWVGARPQGVREVSGHPARVMVGRWAEASAGAVGPIPVVEAALAMNLVTPFTGAVVLENADQYRRHGLEPATADQVPSIPEPTTTALVAIGGGAAWLGRRRRRSRR